MKFILTVLLALVLLSIESVVVKYFGFAVTRIDVTVVLVAFLALRASTLEGAFASFIAGYLLDLMSGRPTGLYTFLAVLTFLIGRLAASLVDVRTPLSFALFAIGADVGHSLLAAFFTWMTSKEATGGALLTGIPLQIALTGLVSILMYPLLRKIDPGNERPQVGTLR